MKLFFPSCFVAGCVVSTSLAEVCVPDGYVEHAHTLPTIGWPIRPLIVDLDSDGEQDILVSTSRNQSSPDGPSGEPSVLFYRGNGDGEFDAPISLLNPVRPGIVAVEDIDCDGVLDLALIESDLQAVQLYFGLGGLAYSAPTNLPCTIPLNVVFEDLDNDGDTDVLVYERRTQSVFQSRAYRLFEQIDPRQFAFRNRIDAPDFAGIPRFITNNKDSVPDFVINSVEPGGVLLFNSTHLQFQYEIDDRLVDPTVIATNGLAQGDINNDGNDEFLSFELLEDLSFALAVYGINQESDFTLLFRREAEDTGSNSPRFADFDLDGLPDLLTLWGSSGPAEFQGHYNVRLNDGKGDFLAPQRFQGTIGFTPTLGDLDADGRPDLVGLDFSSELHVYLSRCIAQCHDLSNDNRADSTDLAIMLNQWGTPNADLDGNGVTDSYDLSLLLAGWGDCP